MQLPAYAYAHAGCRTRAREFFLNYPLREREGLVKNTFLGNIQEGCLIIFMHINEL